MNKLTVKLPAPSAARPCSSTNELSVAFNRFMLDSPLPIKAYSSAAALQIGTSCYIHEYIVNKSKPMSTKHINLSLLQRTADEARLSPRLRKNANFHPNDEFPAHRLINAMQPGSYVRPHRHLNPTKDETIVALQGGFGYIEFDEDGTIIEVLELKPAGPTFGIDIPHGTFHTILALEADSVFFEAKAGPFVPLTTEEIASWSPIEGSDEANALWTTWRTRFA